MRDEQEPMQRLSQTGPSRSSLEACAGAFLAEARPLAGLDHAQIALIERRLRHPRRALLGLRLWPAVVTVVVLLMASTVMALVGGWRPGLPFLGRLADGDARPGSSPAAQQRSSRRPTNRAALGAGPVALPPTSTSTPALPVAMAPFGEAPSAPMARRPARAESSSPAALEAPADSPLSAEARSLSQALATWRRDGHAERALALLSAHERRFAHGALSVEAKVARAEILLSLARREQALDVLDGLSVADLPRARELATIRGELRARVGRCDDARTDLARVLRVTTDDDLAKRAAAALATCP